MLRLSVWLMFGIILITTACAPGADSVIVPLVTLTDMPDPNSDNCPDCCGDCNENSA